MKAKAQTDEHGIMLLSQNEMEIKDSFLPTNQVIGKILKSENSEDRSPIVGQWTLNSDNLKGRTQLLLAPNTPLLAVEVHYAYVDIAWSAGAGWPTYRVPAPLQNYVPGDLHPNFEHHSILWEFGGIVTKSNFMQGGDRGNRISEVYVMVNDDKYDDNTGSITLQVTAYSQS